MTYFSVEDAMKYATELTNMAADSIRDYPGSEKLVDLAYFLLDRKF